MKALDSHASGRIWSSPSISGAVATLVATMQNASRGVCTLMACQLRFNSCLRSEATARQASTVAFVNMPIQFTNYDLRSTSPAANMCFGGACSLLIPGS